MCHIHELDKNYKLSMFTLTVELMNMMYESTYDMSTLASSMDKGLELS